MIRNRHSSAPKTRLQSVASGVSSSSSSINGSGRTSFACRSRVAPHQNGVAVAVYAALFMKLDTQALSSNAHMLQLPLICNRGGAELMKLWTQRYRRIDLPKPLQMLALCGMSESLHSGQEGIGTLKLTLQMLLATMRIGSSAVIIVDTDASSIHRLSATSYANYDSKALAEDGKSFSNAARPGESLFLCGMKLNDILGRYTDMYDVYNTQLYWLLIDNEYLSGCDRALFKNFQAKDAVQKPEGGARGAESTQLTPPAHIGAPITTTESEALYETVARHTNVDEEHVFRCLQNNTQGDIVTLLTFWSLSGLSVIVLVGKAVAALRFVF